MRRDDCVTIGEIRSATLLNSLQTGNWMLENGGITDTFLSKLRERVENFMVGSRPPASFACVIPIAY